MLTEAKGFFRKLHQDESGPNTVEWVLLIIVALIVLLGIFFLAQWVIAQTTNRQKNVTNQGMNPLDTGVGGVQKK